MSERAAVRAVTVRCGPGQAHALERGDGPCAVVVATPPLDAGAYLPLVVALGERFRAVALQVSADEPERSDDRDARLVEVAAAALPRLGVGRAVVIGQEGGARLAVRLATAAPGIVAGLVLAAPAPLQGIQAVQLPVLLYRRGRIVEHPALFARALTAFAQRLDLGSA